MDIAGLQHAAESLDDAARARLLTEIGGWGPWINGGGWLQVNQVPVDLLYRDYRKVREVMEQCISGNITIEYQPGHPHGFINSIYFAEIALCQVLWDPTGQIRELKARTVPYPIAMKKAMIQKFWWEAAFALETGNKGKPKNDLAYMAGSYFRAIACLNQVLFALNERYLMNEKGAAALAAELSLAPQKYAVRINNVVSLLKENPDCLEQSSDELQNLICEVKYLIG